jgi:hypothetical protein
MLVAKTRMYETKQSGWIQQAEGACAGAGAKRSTDRRQGRKIRVCNARNLGRARNRMPGAGNGIAHDPIAVNRARSGRSFRLLTENFRRKKTKIPLKIRGRFSIYCSHRNYRFYEFETFPGNDSLAMSNLSRANCGSLDSWTTNRGGHAINVLRDSQYIKAYR